MPCNILLKSSFVIKDKDGRKIPFTKRIDGVVQFATIKGKEYHIETK
jgi:hypothetical protein